MKAYLIGGEYDLTVIRLTEGLDAIRMAPRPKLQAACTGETFDDCRTFTVLIYRKVGETPNGNLVYELEDLDQ